jgi:hypothetical protein
MPNPVKSDAMESCLGSLANSFLIAALLVVGEPKAALAWQAAVFQAADVRDCQQVAWKARGKASGGGAVMGKLLGLKGCSSESGWLGDGTLSDPYRLALDGIHNAVDVDGIEASTGADYTVQVWFRVRTNGRGLVMLVDSRTDRAYVPLRMMVSSGKLQCSIEMPFPDRFYMTSPSVPIATDRWQNAACRYRAESRELSLFLNGRMTGSTRVPPGTIRSNRIRIGGDPSVDGEYFAGDIAEVVFSAKSDEASVILGRCKEESGRFAGAKCRE